jgi:hypothetical protein
MPRADSAAAFNSSTAARTPLPCPGITDFSSGATKPGTLSRGRGDGKGNGQATAPDQQKGAAEFAVSATTARNFSFFGSFRSGSPRPGLHRIRIETSEAAALLTATEHPVGL